MATTLKAIIRRLSRVFITQGLLIANVFVFQQGDTLKFLKNNEVIDQWLLFEDPQNQSSDHVVYTKKSKVSADSSYFFIYEEKRHTLTDSVFTKITLYNAEQEKLWEISADPGTKISYHLSNIYTNTIILVTTDNDYNNPTLEIITNKEKTLFIKKDRWHRIINYAISPNMRYFVLHAKNPYNKKTWDYIYSIDLKTHKSWTYLFPICVSCKRYKRISLNVKNDGAVDVVYKYRHRVFDKTGKLIDFYITFE